MTDIVLQHDRYVRLGLRGHDIRIPLHPSEQLGRIFRWQLSLGGRGRGGHGRATDDGDADDRRDKSPWQKKRPKEAGSSCNILTATIAPLCREEATRKKQETAAIFYCYFNSAIAPLCREKAIRKKQLATQILCHFRV